MFCKGETKSGTPCRRKAGASGYCSTHNPDILAEHKQRDDAISKQRAQLAEVIDIVLRTAAAKGWTRRLTNHDTESWRYATVVVERSIPSGGGIQTQVSGQINLTVGDVVKLSIDQTSFYKHGILDLRDAIWSDIGKLSWIEPKKKKPVSEGVDRVLKIADRFHTIATQIKRRYDGRETLRINDEYDVQDLLHALLKIDFDDVRPEEYSPSKGGGSSRLDFLLKSQKVVIEAKMARKTLTDKKLGEELIIDIERYRSHPDCDALVCLVYDPDHHIRNPTGLQRDLSRSDGKLIVHVIVVPK